jgi:hypothetical protein
LDPFHGLFVTLHTDIIFNINKGAGMRPHRWRPSALHRSAPAISLENPISSVLVPGKGSRQTSGVRRWPRLRLR